MKKYQITGFYWQKLRLTHRVIQDFARFSSNSFKAKWKPEQTQEKFEIFLQLYAKSST